MKKFLCVMTIALTAAIIGAGTVVYAEENVQSYPELASRLTFTGLTSYAVNDGGTQYAFAEGSYIYIFDVKSQVTDGAFSGTLNNDGTNLYYYSHTSDVTDITYDGDSLVFTDGSGVYQFDSGSAVASEYVFESDAELTLYNGIYYSIEEGVLYYYAGKIDVGSLSDGAYSCLKIFGDSLYVVKDNVLCKVTGTAVDNVSLQAFTFDYLDLTLGETIEADGAADMLSTLNSSVSLVTLTAGTYVTNIDLSDLSGTYFAVGSQGTFALTEAATYLYLGSIGNIYMISDGNDVYLTSDSGTVQSVTSSRYTSTYALLNTAVNMYSLPYMCDSTALTALECGAQVTVNGVYTNDVMQCGFAYVTYTADDGTESTGYVAVNFLTEYEFTAEDGSYNEAEYTEDYSEDNVILNVVLVMVIVVLVIIGIAYVSYSANKGKRKEDDEDR